MATTPDALHPDLTALCISLDSLAAKVMSASSDDRYFSDLYGWPCPAINRHGLKRAACELLSRIQENGPTELDIDTVKLVQEAKVSVDKIRDSTVPNIFGGNCNPAASAYLHTISRIREDLEPILGWQTIRDDMLPAKMVRRLRAFQATLNALAPDAYDLAQKLNLISQASEAAESLPTDLEELKRARIAVEKCREDSLLDSKKTSGLLQEADAVTDAIRKRKDQTDKLVEQCEDAYRITTTKGLSAAFDKRAKALSNSMWVWVLGLVGALALGYWLGHDHIEEMAGRLNSKGDQTTPIWQHLVLTIASLAGPIWFAWMATKQIGQRFRLAEDYAFKASVAKAYEGYRKEAARIDKEFEARLFASALTRLEEPPLRLVETKTPGSPWHEFLESEAFRMILEKAPEVANAIKTSPEKFLRKKANGKGEKGAFEPSRELPKP